MLVPGIDILARAKKGGYAVGSFNTCNLEITQAIIAAASKLSSPVIIGTSEGEVDYAGARYIAKLVAEAADEAKIPVALHLDHGKSLKEALECLEAGYTSIHIDGSSLSFEENIGLTLGVVEAAHAVGASVEGELGHIGGTSEIHSQKEILEIVKKSGLTNSKEAAKFVSSTGIDCLAVAIGNAHGVYRTAPQLDFERLKKIKKETKIPLVLHGGSGIAPQDIKKAIKLGICKINVNTELRFAFINTLRETLEKNKEEIVPYKIFPPSKEAVFRIVLEKIRLFGSENKA